MKLVVTGESGLDQINVNGGQQAHVIDVTAALVSSVNGRTGTITGLAEAADVQAIAEAAAQSAGADAVDTASAATAAQIAAHSSASDPHADRAYADSKFLPYTGGTVNGPLNRDGTAGTYRSFTFQSGGVDRWQIQCDGTAETGSDAGSNLRISARHDDGTDNGVAWWINRATRQVAVNTASALGTAAFTANGPVGIRDQAADPTTVTGGIQLYSKSGKSYLKQADGSVIQLGVVTSTKSAVFPTPTGAVSYAVWRATRACTVTAVRGYRAGGTGATINASRNASTLATTDLSLSTAATWLSAPALQNTAMAAGDTLTLSVTGITGTPTAITIQVDTQG